MKKNRIEEEPSLKILNLSKRRKICLIMKNFILLMLVFNLAAVANTNGQRIKKFEVKDASLKSCIFKIQKMTNYGFIYNGLEIDKIKGINIDLKNVNVKDVLNAILVGTNFCYEITDKVIAIKKINLSQQQNTIKVKGNVKDKEGKPLPGVTIMIKGTIIGVVTNEKGYFNLSINKSDKVVLVFSFVGMKTQEIKYKGKNEINVVLLDDVKELEDVVVTGYENVRKVSYTGNAVRVKGEDLLKVSGR
ncbi:MAG: carboxypeptidase-like regulatory domain-containing protein, partial [Bacilli bacterium]